MMKNKYIEIVACKTVLLLFFGVVFSVSSQQPLEREVVVTKDFKPIIQDAKRIEIQPEIKDTVQIKPSFTYNVYPIPAKSKFELKPIKPAKLVGIPVSELYNYYVRGGLGNRHLPLLEVYANNLRSDDYIIGAALEIENIEGKIKLDSEEKVNASNSHIRFMGYGKQFLDQVNLEGNIGIDFKKSHYYGLVSDSIYEPMPDGKDIKQSYSTVFAQGKVYSTRLEPKYSYYLDIMEQYTWDRFEYHENDVKINFLNKVKLSAFDIHIDTKLQFLSNNMPEDTVSTASFIAISPYLSNQQGDFRYRLGINLTVEVADQDANAYIHPLANVEYSLAGSVLTTFFGLEGKYISSTYKEILDENPFVRPGSYARPSDMRLRAFGGIKGDITKSLSYQVDAELKNVKDHILYVIDTVGNYDNYYKILYGDVDMIRFGANMKYNIKNKFDLSLGGNSYSYDAGSEPYAWHLPNWDANLDISYNIQDKVTLSGNLNVIGKRYARDLNEQAVELKPFAVFDLQVDYNFSKVLSAFITIQNLNASQYDLWYHYPYFKTMVVIGAAYKF